MSIYLAGLRQNKTAFRYVKQTRPGFRFVTENQRQKFDFKKNQRIESQRLIDKFRISRFVEINTQINLTGDKVIKGKK